MTYQQPVHPKLSCAAALEKKFFWQQAEAGSLFQITTARGGVSTPPFSPSSQQSFLSSKTFSMIRMKSIFALLFLVTLISEKSTGQAPAPTLPNFEFSRLDKSPFTNKDLPAGKIILLVFFDAGCEHCQQAAKNIDRQYPSFEKAAIFFISLDPPEKMIQFMTACAPDLRKKKNVKLLSDSRNEFITRFGPRRYPSMFLYSPKGRLIDYEDNEETVFRLAHYAATSNPDTSIPSPTHL